MNCLAHALIASRRGESIVGNLLGDFVHGRVDDRYDADFAQGIRIHRAIDAFTDAHPRTLVSRQRLRPPYRRWGGVLIDVFFDHFLANDWSTYNDATLREFADHVYADLAHRREELPARMRGFAHYMTSTDLLVAYREVSGIDRALKGLSARVRRDNPLHDASGELVRLFAELEGDFRAFFPDLLEEFRGDRDSLA